MKYLLIILVFCAGCYTPALTYTYEGTLRPYINKDVLFGINVREVRQIEPTQGWEIGDTILISKKVFQPTRMINESALRRAVNSFGLQVK